MCQVPCLMLEYREDKEKITCPNGVYIPMVKAADQQVNKSVNKISRRYDTSWARSSGMLC